MVANMGDTSLEPIPTIPVIQQVMSAGIYGLIIGTVVVVGAVALMFLALWGSKKKRSIC
jgi:hypothetical protein